MEPTALYRRRPSEQIELSGLWWQITQPASSVGTRLYRRGVALAGEQVIREVVLGILKTGLTEADSVKVQLWGVDEATRILRKVHAGEIVQRNDLIELQLALAPLIPPGSMDKIGDLGSELLWESGLSCSKQRGTYTGPNTFGADRSDRTVWEHQLDAIIPDVPTRTLLEIWAFLLLSRPSSAGSATAR